MCLGVAEPFSNSWRLQMAFRFAFNAGPSWAISFDVRERLFRKLDGRPKCCKVFPESTVQSFLSAPFFGGFGELA
jgi:hypothetical protein